MIEVDEGERVRAECIKLFALPMNERLLLKVRDLVIGCYVDEKEYFMAM
jgi:hypothetical protein